MTNHGFPKRLRLLCPSDFERVFAARTSAADGLLILHGAVNELKHARLGLAVSRKVGGAVVRNRWKRALREAFRLSQHELPAVDIICIPRAAGVPLPAELLNSLSGLAQRVQRSRSNSVNSKSALGTPPTGSSQQTP